MWNKAEERRDQEGQEKFLAEAPRGTSSKLLWLGVLFPPMAGIPPHTLSTCSTVHPLQLGCHVPMTDGK